MANEVRLIDANALKEKLQYHHDFFVDGVGGFHYLTPKDKARVDEITHCIAEIVNAPTVEAVEVVHGEWCEYYETFVDDGGAESFPIQTGYVCSECGVDGSAFWRYCPYCGAKMDGGNEDVV